jgi:hypothetical protein
MRNYTPIQYENLPQRTISITEFVNQYNDNPVAFERLQDHGVLYKPYPNASASEFDKFVLTEQLFSERQLYLGWIDTATDPHTRLTISPELAEQ